MLLCPRGLAAVPLLCAAASESRSAYLARLQVTHPSNGVRELLFENPCSHCMALYVMHGSHDTRVSVASFSLSPPPLYLLQVVGEAGTALSRGGQPPIDTRKVGHRAGHLRRVRIPDTGRSHGRGTYDTSHVATRHTGIPVAGTQRLPVRVDMSDTRDYLPDEPIRHVPDAALRGQADQLPPRQAVRGGGSPVRARRGIALRVSPGHRRSGFGAGAHAPHDRVRRFRWRRRQAGGIGGQSGVRLHGRLRLVVLGEFVVYPPLGRPSYEELTACLRVDVHPFMSALLSFVFDDSSGLFAPSTPKYVCGIF